MPPPTRARRLPAVVVLVAIALLATGCTDVETLSTEEALERSTVASTKLYAADGSLVANLHGEINRDIVRLEDTPTHVRDAVVAVEDQRFWDHAGVDARSITRAFIANVRSAETVQGGSTISQQLVKNLYFPAAERTLGRKIEEARYAIDFERRYSKDEILEMYVNTIYLGRGAYGFQAAAKAYFDSDLAQLSLGQSAFLAGLIHEPGSYDLTEVPDGEARDAARPRGEARRNSVIDRMAGLRMIGLQEAEAAKAQPLEMIPKAPNRWRHPYFVDYVLRTLGVLDGRGNLDSRYDALGKTASERARMVYQGGLRIHTTLDPGTQVAAEEAVTRVLPEQPDRLSAAVVSMEPGSGAVRALVGGREYYAGGCSTEVPEAEQPRDCRLAKVNLALGSDGGGSGRQPGSGFKPVVLAAALDDGHSLGDMYHSSQFRVRLPAGDWNVRNYEGSGGGAMSVLEGTAKSVNAVYARLEVDGLGDGDAIRGSGKVAAMARRLGVGFPTPEALERRCGDDFNRHGGCTPADVVPAIALGAKEVSPLEMATAYATIASGGVRAAPYAIEKITDMQGEVLFEAEPRTKRVIPEKVAHAVTYALRQAVERGTGTRARLRGRQVAGKTGTSQQWRDAWFTGYVPQLATAVWVGNPIPVEQRDGSWTVESMTPANGYATRIVGGSYPATIWNRLMTRALQGVRAEDFPDPPRELLNSKQRRTPPESVRNDVQERLDDDALRHAMPLFGAGPARTSAGPATVPAVMGMSVAAARNAIARAGLRSAGVKQCPSGGSRGGGLRVWQQSPGGGGSIARGSTVTVWYSSAVC